MTLANAYPQRYLRDKFDRARKALLDAGIVAIDGSGDRDVEDLLALYSQLIYGRATVRKGA